MTGEERTQPATVHDPQSPPSENSVPDDVEDWDAREVIAQYIAGGIFDATGHRAYPLADHVLDGLTEHGYAAVRASDLAEVLRLLRDYGKPCDRDNCEALTCLAIKRLEATSLPDGGGEPS